MPHHSTVTNVSPGGARNSFLGTAAEDINLKIIHAHILAEHAGDGIHHREYPVFFSEADKAQRCHFNMPLGGIAVHERCIFVIVMFL